jgi:hypothetical protein
MRQRSQAHLESRWVKGLTFTTLRDGGIDHLGMRTLRGIVDVAQAAQALGIPAPPRTVDDLLAGRGNISSLEGIAAEAPVDAIRAENAVESDLSCQRLRRSSVWA